MTKPVCDVKIFSNKASSGAHLFRYVWDWEAPLTDLEIPMFYVICALEANIEGVGRIAENLQTTTSSQGVSFLIFNQSFSSGAWSRYFAVQVQGFPTLFWPWGQPPVRTDMLRTCCFWTRRMKRWHVFTAKETLSCPWLTNSWSWLVQPWLKTKQLFEIGARTRYSLV